MHISNVASFISTDKLFITILFSVYNTQLNITQINYFISVGEKVSR